MDLRRKKIISMMGIHATGSEFLEPRVSQQVHAQRAHK